jgi:hypothetical protein
VSDSTLEEVKKRHFEYSAEEINDRFVDHWEFADDFITGFLAAPERENSKLQIDVNPRRLRLAIASAYKDIARYKNFHQDDPWTERLDCVKRSSYLVKWIVQVKPVTVTGLDGDAQDIENFELDEIEIINELFAIHLYELHLSDEIYKNIALSDDKLFELAYDLIYRHVSVDGWIAVFQLIKDCCSPKIVKGVPFVKKMRLPKKTD